MLSVSLNKTFPSFLLKLDQQIMKIIPNKTFLDTSLKHLKTRLLINSILDLKFHWYYNAKHPFCAKRNGIYCPVHGNKEMFYLMTPSTNFTYTYIVYGIKLMAKDHSDSKRGNLLPPLCGLPFLISSKESFICTIP